MHTHVAQGIILRSIDFRDRQKILTIFSKENGVISMIVKDLSKNKSYLQAHTSPLIEVEFSYEQKRSDLVKCVEIKTIDPHFSLREKYASLALALEITEVIYRSQLPGKPSPMLYRLLSSYLKQIAKFDSLLSVKASFYLKLLKHEGLLAFAKECALCHDPIVEYFSSEGSFCQKHLPPALSSFRGEEKKRLEELSYCSSFGDFRSCS